MKRYTLKELQALKTVFQGHFDDTKIDTGTERVLLSRMTVADGMPYDNQVTVERLVNGNWKTMDQYKAL